MQVSKDSNLWRFHWSNLGSYHFFNGTLGCYGWSSIFERGSTSIFGVPPRTDQVSALITLIDWFYFFGGGSPCSLLIFSCSDLFNFVLLSEILSEILKSFLSNYCPQYILIEELPVKFWMTTCLVLSPFLLNFKHGYLRSNLDLIPTKSSKGFYISTLWECFIWCNVNVRVNQDHFAWCDLAYFWPRHSILWYMRHIYISYI